MTLSANIALLFQFFWVFGFSLSPQALFVTNITGNTSQEFQGKYVTAFIGNPPQQQVLLLDTNTAMTSAVSTLCPPYLCSPIPQPFYSLSQSSTFNWKDTSDCPANSKKVNGHCQYNDGQNTYYITGEKGLLSNELEEMFENLENFTEAQKSKCISDYSKAAVNLSFILIEKLSSVLIPQQISNGVLGLGPKTNGTLPVENFIVNLAQAVGSNFTGFSICFGRDGGSIGIGGHVNTPKTTPTLLSYSSLYSSKSFYSRGSDSLEIGSTSQYQFKLTSFKIEGDSTSIEPASVIIDSTKTITSLTNNIYFAFLSSFQSFCSKRSSNCGGSFNVFGKACYDLGIFSEYKELYETFPNISFVLEGPNGDAEFSVSPENYLILSFSEDSLVSCFEFDYSYTGQVVIGMNFLQNKELVFDLDEETIEVFDADCGPRNSADMGLFLGLYHYKVPGLLNKVLSAAAFFFATFMAFSAVVLLYNLSWWRFFSLSFQNEQKLRERKSSIQAHEPIRISIPENAETQETRRKKEENEEALLSSEKPQILN